MSTILHAKEKISIENVSKIETTNCLYYRYAFLLAASLKKKKLISLPIYCLVKNILLEQKSDLISEENVCFDKVLKLAEMKASDYVEEIMSHIPEDLGNCFYYFKN